MKYVIDDKKYEVEVIKKNNKNTYVRIKDGKIYVTTSYLASKIYIKYVLDNNYEYIKKMINKWEEKNYKNSLFYYLGNNYDIIIVPTLKEIMINDNKIFVKDESSLNKWIKKQTKEIFENHLKIIYDKFEEDIPYPELRIRKMTTRWGVCNKNAKKVTLNSELIKYSFDKLDYVIVHELSHFIHFDHSKAFWETVSKYCPNYKIIRKSLK